MTWIGNYYLYMKLLNLGPMPRVRRNSRAPSFLEERTAGIFFFLNCVSKFSKASCLVYLLYKGTVERTFENFLPWCR